MRAQPKAVTTLLKKSPLFTLTVFAALAGCSTQTAANREGGGQHGTSDSVVASISGVSDQDKQRNLTYTLGCDSGVQVAGIVKADGSSVSFTGSKVHPGDTCAMEVTMDAKAAAALPWNWYGKDKAGAARVGLLYATDKQTVKSDLSLALTIYRTYLPITPASQPSFSMKLWVSVDPASLSATVKAPAEGATANLDCGVTNKQAGVYHKAAAAGASDFVSFDNQVLADLVGKTCTKLSVLTADSTAFTVATPEISLAAVAAGNQLVFPTADQTKPYVLKALVNGDISVSTLNGGQCMDFSAAGVCTGLAWKMPLAQSYIAAEVAAKAADGTLMTLMVGAGAGFDLYSGASLTVDALNSAAQNVAATGAEPGTPTFSFFKNDMEAAFTTPGSVPFNADFIAGVAFAKSRLNYNDLSGVQVLSINAVYVHAFHPVTDAVLNARATTGAHWFTLVTAAKAGQPNAQFIVSGKTADLYSAAAQAKSGAAPVYFDTASYLAQMTAAAAPAPAADIWQTYALSGGAMAAAGCTADLAAYQREAGGLNADSVQGATVSPVLSACMVTKDKFNADLAAASWTVTETPYLWDWYALAK